MIKTISRILKHQSENRSLKKSILLAIDQSLMEIAVHSRFLSSLYYLLASSSFAREHQACIYGKLKYQSDLSADNANHYLLRRNIHRIEKGLLMRPRRDIFAVDYIEETLRSYQQALANQGPNSDGEELQWAYDVLSEYFSIVGVEPTIEKCKRDFLSLTDSESIHRRKIPYQRGELEDVPVDYDSLLSLAIRRRSVRWYLQKPVARDLIDQAIQVALLSPSACNRQPFEFRIFDDPDQVKRIASIPMGTKGFSDNFPVIIVVIGKLRAYYSERDRHIIYIDAALAAMSLMYALETLKLASCPINWPDIESKEQQMSDLLNLEPDERPIMLISLGHPDPQGMVAYSQKKSLDIMRQYNA